MDPATIFYGSIQTGEIVMAADPDIRIQRLLPHRGRMLLIEEIVSMDKKGAVARATVRDTWPTADHGQVGAILIVELVAQTAGLVDGDNRLVSPDGDACKKGWLVGIKNLQMEVETLPVGTCLEVVAQDKFEFEGFKEIQGQVYRETEQVGCVSLQVMQAEDANLQSKKDNLHGG